jgi:hypothetical protein
VNFNSEIADSGPHLSAAARRTGPAWQRTAAAWPPRAALTLRLKAAVGTARRVSRQQPRPRRARPTAAPRSVPPPSPRRPRHVPTASCAPLLPRLPHRRPDRLADRTAVRRSRVGEPLLLSCFPRTGTVSSPARQAVPPRVAPRARSRRVPRRPRP